MNGTVKYLYIYNVVQSNFYISNGVMPTQTGINPNTNKIWYKFKKDETTEVYALWMRGRK